MRPAVILLILSSQLGIGLGYPADGSDNSVGFERPSTETPPQVSECGEDVFGNSDCEDGGGNNPSSSVGPQPNPQPSLEGCMCVKYYLCNNNTINEDGEGLISMRMKDDKCTSNLDTCCRVNDIQPMDQPLIPTPRPTGGRTCGNRNSEGIGFRIPANGNNEAEYGEFPWMVAVLKPVRTLNKQGKSTLEYQCGGSLIHPQVVLTAAHCVRGEDNLVIRAGDWDIQTKNEVFPTQDRNVSEVIVHEQFNKGSLANDPALLILENPVDMSLENVGLICLPEPNEKMDGRDCVASGWGKDLYGEEGIYSEILKRVEVPMVPKNQCLQALRKTRLGPHFKLHESFVCAGGQPGKDTCTGDGGSPLVCPSQNNPRVYVQAGIVAWGIGCATETPGVYVNVPYFVKWINNKMKARNIV